MSDQHLAFMIGLLGSIHCVGMCGPLAFAVPVRHPGSVYLVWNKLIYQVGRILSYMLLGAIIGLLGKGIWMAGIQQGVSIFSGVLILAAAASRLFKISTGTKQSILIKPFYKAFHYAYQHQANHLIIGIINGFLPCGFVYMALAGALNTGSVSSASGYMFWYGMGTLPLMFMAGVMAGFGSAVFRRKINSAVPYLMICLGVWFILRGMELNIPYLSPAAASSVTSCR